MMMRGVTFMLFALTESHVPVGAVHRQLKNIREAALKSKQGN